MYVKSEQTLLDELIAREDSKIDHGLNEDYLSNEVSHALENMELCEKAIGIIDRHEDLVKNPEWLEVTSKIDTRDESLSLEVSDHLQEREDLKRKLVGILLQFSKVASSAMKRLLDDAEITRVKIEGHRKLITKAKLNKKFSEEMSIPQNKFQLLTCKGSMISIEDLDKVVFKLIREKEYTLTALTSMLTNYKERLNLYLQGAIINAPNLDMYAVIRRTENYKGTENQLKFDLSEIGCQTIIDRLGNGESVVRFIVPDLNESDVRIPFPDTKTLIKFRDLILMTYDNRYLSRLRQANAQMNKLVMELVTLINTRDVEDTENQKKQYRLSITRDFNKLALFSTIRMFGKVIFFNLFVINELHRELENLLRPFK